MDAAAELGRNPVSPRFSLSVENKHPFIETKLSGANGDREMFIFPVQPTPSGIGNLSQLIHTPALDVTINNCMGLFLCDPTNAYAFRFS